MPPRRHPRGHSPSPSEDGLPPPPPLPEIDPVLMRNFMQQFIQYCARQPAPQVQTEGRTQERALDKFLRYGPPKFFGTNDDRKAEAWIIEIEKTFRAIQSVGRESIECAIFLLQGPAHEWWRSVERRWIATGTVYTWERFLIEFREKYIPRSLRIRREREFMDLKQGTMSVADYEAKFQQLSAYAPHIVEDKERKARKFVDGLRRELKTALSPFSHAEWTKAVERAKGVEATLEEDRPPVNRAQLAGFKRPFSSSGQSSGKKSKPSKFKPPVPRPTGNVDTVCSHCGRPGHTEPGCWRKTGRCLVCGSDQHLARDCPHGRPMGTRGKPTGNVNKPKVHARAYTLRGEDEEDPNPTSVVEGIMHS